jgi:hypothetical protein
VHAWEVPRIEKVPRVLDPRVGATHERSASTGKKFSFAISDTPAYGALGALVLVGVFFNPRKYRHAN